MAHNQTDAPLYYHTDNDLSLIVAGFKQIGRIAHRQHAHSADTTHTPHVHSAGTTHTNRTCRAHKPVGVWGRSLKAFDESAPL